MGAGDADDGALLYDIEGMKGSLVETQLRHQVSTGHGHRPSAAVERELLKARAAHARSVAYPAVTREAVEWNIEDLSGEPPYNPCPEVRLLTPPPTTSPPPSAFCLA